MRDEVYAGQYGVLGSRRIDCIGRMVDATD
jgi:hypothetical protein